MGFTIDDPQHVYFWLLYMKTYFKQISPEDEIMFLKKFESFDQFNISMILKYLDEIIVMDEN